MATVAIRPTQAERTAISRDKVIRAAIQCLVERGYAATSITMIAKTAKISIGRMQHHFATKAEIMAAVIDFVHQQNNKFLSTRKLKGGDPATRVVEYVRLLQTTFEMDYVPATIEIRMAMRGDRELAAAVEPKFRQYDTRSFADIEDLLMAAGMAQDKAHAWMRLIISAVRGMAVERIANYQIADKVDSRQSLDMLTALLLATP